MMMIMMLKSESSRVCPLRITNGFFFFKESFGFLGPGSGHLASAIVHVTLLCQSEM